MKIAFLCFNFVHTVAKDQLNYIQKLLKGLIVFQLLNRCWSGCWKKLHPRYNWRKKHHVRLWNAYGVNESYICISRKYQHAIYNNAIRINIKILKKQPPPPPKKKISMGALIIFCPFIFFFRFFIFLFCPTSFILLLSVMIMMLIIFSLSKIKNPTFKYLCSFSPQP